MKTHLFCSACGANRLAHDASEGGVECIVCGNVAYQNSKPAVCAIIIKDGMVLLVQSGKIEGWDVPGGFLRLGENPEDGLRRELSEELNIQIEDVRLLEALIDPYGTEGEFSLNLFYEVNFNGDLEPTVGSEIERLGWFPLAELPPLKYKGTGTALRRYVESPVQYARQVEKIASTCRIPWSEPCIGPAEIQAVAQVMESGWLSMGARTRLFEERWADVVSARHAVAVSNGTVALDIALAALGIGRDDEVALPAIGYIAIVSSIIRCGAKPVFVDVDVNTLNMAPQDLASKVSDRCRCIVYMDYGGIPAQSDAIRDIGRSFGIPVLHDAAQTMGARRNGQMLGLNGDISTTSFHATKLATAIEGGMIFTNNDQLATVCRKLRNQGEDPKRKYFHSRVGFNGRITDMQAAIGLVQLKRLNEAVDKRNSLAAVYTELLRTANVKIVMSYRAEELQSWFFYSVLIEGRDSVARMLKDQGIDTRSPYPLPLYRQRAVLKSGFEVCESRICPNAEFVARRVLALPMYENLRRNQQQRVVSTLIEALEGIGERTGW